MNTNEKIGLGVASVALIPQIIAGIIMFLIGLGMVLVSVLSSFHSNYIETEAVIVDSRYDEKEKEYIPTYEYEVDGEMVRVEAFGVSDPNDIEIGYKVTIAYNPDDYRVFDIGGKEESHTLLILGAILMILTGTFFIDLFRSAKKLKQNLQY